MCTEIASSVDLSSKFDNDTYNRKNFPVEISAGIVQVGYNNILRLNPDLANPS
jgi:hypothetical protein